MDETSRCGERRALNARERSGDATSGDERRRDERRRDGEASPAAEPKRSSSAGTASAQKIVLQAYRLTSFCEARLLLELRVLAYGLSLTDRPTAVPLPTQQPARPLSTRCNQSPEPTELEIA